MTFAQVKIECLNKKLEIGGSKDDLIKRLMKHAETTTTTGSKASVPVTTTQSAAENVATKPVFSKTPITAPTTGPEKMDQKNYGQSAAKWSPMMNRSVTTQSQVIMYQNIVWV